MKIAKHLIVVFVAILSCLDAIGYTETVDGITWRYGIQNSSYAYLGDISPSDRAISTSISGAIEIPSTLGGFPVRQIRAYAFYECNGLTSVIIPNGVSSIGYYAFDGCSVLTSVTIPGSVTEIGDRAFTGCSGLKRLTISNGVKRISAGAFAGCNGLTSVMLPVSVERLYWNAFNGCNSLTNFYLSKRTLCYDSPSIPSSAIIRYTPYQNVTLDTKGGTVPNANIEVEYGSTYGDLPEPFRVGYTFDGWTLNGDEISADTTVAALDDHTLVAQWTPNKHSVTFDANGGEGGTTGEQCYGTAIVAPTVTRTGYTFKGWDKEVAETVPDEDVTYVAQWQINQYNVMFDANGGVGGMVDKLDYGTVITAPLVSRAGCTFEGWSPSPDQTVPAHDVEYTAQWKVWDITVNSADSSVRELYPDDYFRITNIVIGAEVDCVPTGFFDGCDAVECLTFRSGDTDLGDNNLRSVGNLFEKQPDGFWIVQGALVGYKGRCPEVIPQADTIKRVVSGALEGCVALEELSFTTESVLRFIGDGAFRGCTELKTMTLPPSLESIGDEAFMGCSYLGDVIVPGSVRRVGDRAFKNCTGFTAAQIAYGVESLGEEAFYGDWRISEVDIPSTVTNIGVNAFGGDSSIIRIGLRGDVRKAREIFSNYRSIREATVKEGDGEIVDGLFSGFTSLLDVHFIGDCPALENEGRLLYADTPSSTGNYYSEATDGLVTYVEADSTGWDGTPGSHSLPQAWPLVGGNRRSIAWWDSPTYLCQFDSNGGTLGVQDTYQYSERLITLPPEPVQTGYTFAGWWTQPIGGLRVTADTIFIEGVYTRLYAHWIKGHWVFLDPNGGTVFNDFVTYVEQSVYGVLPTPVRSGYAFGGWLYNGVRIVPETVINETADHTLVAQWTANLYSVRFDANGGDGDMDDQGFVYGTAQNLRKNLFVRPGYEFLGWATNEVDVVGFYENADDIVIYADCESVSNMTAVADDWIDLYAVWEISSYKVAFDANGGTGTMKAQTINVGASKALTANAFKRTGYTFMGWAKKKDATAADYADQAKVKNLTKTNGATVTLYAVWKANAYTVKFDGNGATSGSMAAQARAYGDGKALPANGFKRTNYYFLGWSTAKGGAVKYANKKVANLSAKSGAVVTLYAVWEISTYKLAFDGNGATSGTVKAQAVNAGAATALTANAFARTGYTFLGWSADEKATAADYADQAKVKNLTKTNGATVTLYAVWKANAYTVKFDGNGATSGSMAAQKRTYGDGKKLTANAFKRTNYHFLGWATKKGGAVKYKDKQAANLSAKSGATVTLYAVWELSSYKVAFNGNGATSGAMKAQAVNVGAATALTANAFARTGYTFLGWSADEKATAVDYADKAKVKNLTKTNGATVTLYAVWKANAYKVKFDGNGATSGAMKNLAMTYGKAKALTANAFARTNWTFLGWAKTKDATAADYADQAKVKNLSKKAGATVTLYAVWRRDTFTVKFDGNGATSGTVKAQTINTATKTALAANAFKRAGYEFLGWSTKKDATTATYTNKAKVKDLAKKGKSVTLYAVWSLPAWAHGTFNGSGGYMPNSQYADWSGGVAVAKISSLGKLSGTLTLEHDGGVATVAFSAKTFSKYYASRTIDQLCDLLDYDEEDEYGLLDDEEDGVAPQTVSAYVYKGVSFAMPDATTRKANLVLLSWPSGDGKTLMGRICLSLTADIELELRENLFVSKRVTLPQFSGTPKKAFKVAAAAEDAEEWERALAELTKVEVTFGANGQLTIVGLNGSKKVWTTSATLNLWGREGKSFDVGTDFLTPTGRCLWFDCRLTPGKDGKIIASGITFEW